MLNLLLTSVCLFHSTVGCVGTFNHTLQLIQIIELVYENSLVDEMGLHARTPILINFHCTWHTKRNLLLAIIFIFLLLKSNFNKFIYLCDYRIHIYDNQYNVCMCVLVSSSQLFRFEGTRQNCVICHLQYDCLFPSMPIYSGPFVFHQHTQSCPVVYTATTLSRSQYRWRFPRIIANNTDFAIV